MIDSRKKRPKDTVVNANPADPQSSSLFEESTAKRKSKVSKTGRLTLPQLHELERKKEEDVKRGHKLLCELWPKILLPQCTDGQELAEREWLLEAEKLVDMFRETRNLFRTSRVSRSYVRTISNVRTNVASPCLEQSVSRHATKESEAVSKKCRRKRRRNGIASPLGHR